MWTSTNKKIWTFLSTIIILGFLGGIFYLTILSKDNQTIITNSISNFFQTIDNLKINYLTSHFLIMPVLIITSFLGIGAILTILYLFYIGFLMGFVISTFVVTAGFKGFIFGLIYLIITRFIFLFFFGILAISLLKITYYLINLIIKKQRQNKEIIFRLLKKVLLAFIFILINDTILYFLGDNLVKIFKFLVI